MTSWIASAARARERRQEIEGTWPGYYLVLPSGARHFISAEVNEAALNRLCDKHLTAETGWMYWVDYLHGFDVRGSHAWSNVDHTDRFL